MTVEAHGVIDELLAFLDEVDVDTPVYYGYLEMVLDMPTVEPPRIWVFGPQNWRAPASSC